MSGEAPEQWPVPEAELRRASTELLLAPYQARFDAVIGQLPAPARWLLRLMARLRR